MTEQPPTNPAPGPPGGRPVVLTYDKRGRVASRTEYWAGGGEPERVTQFRYDELDRIVEMRQISHDPLTDPATP